MKNKHPYYCCPNCGHDPDHNPELTDDNGQSIYYLVDGDNTHYPVIKNCRRGSTLDGNYDD